MIYKILADVIVLIHFLWIIFLFLGALWGRKSKVLKALHLSGLFYALLIQILGWYCPLTHLEFWLRSNHDPALAYTGSFIVHYAERIVYLEFPRQLILLFSTGLVVFNTWIYLQKKKRLSP